MTCNVCIGAGELNRQISLQSRDIAPPIWGDPDFGELFGPGNVVWAKVETKAGKTFFDSVNQKEEMITHEITIRYDSSVTSETWVLFEGRHLDILAVEDVNERHAVMKLTCVDKGASSV